MKLFTFIVFVLAFWPILLDVTVSGLTAPLPTSVSATPTRPIGYTSYTGIAILHVLPTTRMAHHNNGGQSAGWADSTVSISTSFQIYPVRGAVGTKHASFDLAHRTFHAAWSRACHWWQVDSLWLVDGVVTFAVYVLFTITVGVALLSKAIIERRATASQTQRKHVFVSTTTTFIEGSLARGVHELVAHKLSLSIVTLEGRLVLSFGPSTVASPAEWTVLFHPRQYYLATGSATQSSDRNPEPDFAHILLNKLFRQVWVYHPWTWYTQGILVNVAKQVGKEVHTTHKPSVRSIPWIGGAHMANDNGPKAQRRMIVARAVRRPTFTPSITRTGGSPKPRVQQHALPKRPQNPTSWIEMFTLEGRLLLYAGSTPPGQLVNWVIQFRPYSGYHLTMHGDDSSTRQREFMDRCLHEDGSSAERATALVPPNAKEKDDNSREFFDSTSRHAPDSDDVEPLTPIPETPVSLNPTELDAAYDNFIREQKAAVLHELRLLLATLEERAHGGGGPSGLR